MDEIKIVPTIISNETQVDIPLNVEGVAERFPASNTVALIAAEIAWKSTEIISDVDVETKVDDYVKLRSTEFVVGYMFTGMELRNPRLYHVILFTKFN